MAESVGINAAPADALPPLYRAPQMLNAERHRTVGVTEINDFSFAKDAGALPLGADELFLAQAHYPIVFTGNDPPVPVAVLGIGRNLFIESDGRWRRGAYIPAYIRRYPFILAKPAPSASSFLAIDESAACVNWNGGGRPLYDGDKPSTLARQALEFCLAFEMQLGVARNFAEALRAAGILVVRRADLRFNDGSRRTLDGFRVIDEGLFDAMPNDTFLSWRRNGWLGLVYAHLLSMRNWQGLPVGSLAAPT